MAEVFVKEFIFAISLLGTTIQDGGMRERSDGLYYFPISLDTLLSLSLTFFNPF